MKDNLTFEEFVEQLKDKENLFIKHHTCGICECPVGYRIQQQLVTYDSNCGCSSYYSMPQLRTWDELYRDYLRYPSMFSHIND